MKKLTTEQAIVLTGYTEIVCCEFSKFHEDLEKRLGRPVFTHEIPSISDEIKLAYKDDFFEMLNCN